MTDTTQKMLERVRALLAKADDRAVTPEEADAFRAKADELMTRFAIDSFVVDQAMRGASGESQKVERRDFARTWSGSKFRNDLVSLFNACARHCRCVIGWRGFDYDRNTAAVYGLPSDLDYLDLLFTQLSLEVARNLQPPVDPSGEIGHEVFKQRQAGTDWETITRKIFEAGLVKLTTKERERVAAYATGDDVTWSELHWRTDTWVSIKNRLANANRRYVKDNGLSMDRNYIKPDVYQRSFMAGFADEIERRLLAMRQATRAAYNESGQGDSMALAVRDVRAQALALYEQEFPPPPPQPVAPSKGRSRSVTVREVAYSDSAMSAGRAKAREVDLSNRPGQRVGGRRNELPS